MKPSQIKILANANCELAENPLWDAEKQCLYWTDIPAGRIFRLGYATRKYEVIYQGIPVGGFAIQDNGELLLFRVNDIALLDQNGATKSLCVLDDEAMVRFNDVIADPSGRVFAGTIGKTKQSGGLYRVDLDGTITKLFYGTGCSNGMGFSPDLRSFYWTCTTTRRIFQFDYDPSSGNIDRQRIFYQASEDEGVPDGLAVDAEGCIWSARWGGFSIKHHGLDGSVIKTISLPVRNVTSLCFGGQNLSKLFITSARANNNDPASGGALFSTIANTKGRFCFRSKILTRR